MKVGRRSFLSFIIGGAAGTALSPLPWKLTDDLSIWTQAWPWTPVPPDGEISYAASTCALCPGGCGIQVKKVDRRAIKIEGTDGHPINAGGICIRGLSGLQLLYGPTRVKGPMKRDGGRGSGRWVSISWDEALETVAARLIELREQGRPESLAVFSGNRRGTIPAMLSRLLTAYGSPNFVTATSVRDSYELALHRMQGVQASAGLDLEQTDFLLSFGSGVLDGWGSPVRMFRTNSSLKDGRGRLVQVEPRLSNTAAKADQWVAINPGTEAALALGLAHVIILEKRYRAQFVSEYGGGFDAFRQMVMNDYAPDKVAQITGVDAKTIVELAREFSRSSMPLAICGRGEGDTPGSMNEFFAVHALNALIGAVNSGGGIWAVPEPVEFAWPDPEMDNTAATGMQAARLDGAGSEPYDATASLPNRFFESVKAGLGYPVEALFIVEANPCFSQPDPETVKGALGKIPFVVSFSSFMDETAQNADLILPNHVYLERYEDLPNPDGFNRPFVGLVQPVVDPQFNTRNVGDVIIELTQKLADPVAGAFPWESYEDCLKQTYEEQWDAMTTDGYWMAEDFAPAGWPEAFETASGKFEFFPEGLNGGYAPVQVEGGEGAFPLILVSYDSMRISADYVGNPPFMTKTVSDTVLKGNDLLVEVNPRTAQQLGLSEGSRAALTTAKGSAEVRIHLYEGLMPGLVAMARGLGHTAYDKYLAGKGTNFNRLIGPVQDPVSGLNAAWGIRAKLTRA
ncbi:MAG: molybdopterin-dependent oxidoreductase [Desulfobacterales bacterium]|jgi:anaerobic selenocysteine-containing dehydrogenase